MHPSCKETMFRPRREGGYPREGTERHPGTRHEPLPEIPPHLKALKNGGRYKIDGYLLSKHGTAQAHPKILFRLEDDETEGTRQVGEVNESIAHNETKGGGNIGFARRATTGTGFEISDYEPEEVYRMIRYHLIGAVDQEGHNASEHAKTCNKGIRRFYTGLISTSSELLIVLARAVIGEDRMHRNSVIRLVDTSLLDSETPILCGEELARMTRVLGYQLGFEWDILTQIKGGITTIEWDLVKHLVIAYYPQLRTLRKTTPKCDIPKLLSYEGSTSSEPASPKHLRMARDFSRMVACPSLYFDLAAAFLCMYPRSRDDMAAKIAPSLLDNATAAEMDATFKQIGSVHGHKLYDLPSWSAAPRVAASGKAYHQTADMMNILAHILSLRQQRILIIEKMNEAMFVINSQSCYRVSGILDRCPVQGTDPEEALKVKQAAQTLSLLVQRDIKTGSLQKLKGHLEQAWVEARHNNDENNLAFWTTKYTSIKDEMSAAAKSQKVMHLGGSRRTLRWDRRTIAKPSAADVQGVYDTIAHREALGTPAMTAQPTRAPPTNVLNSRDTSGRKRKRSHEDPFSDKEIVYGSRRNIRPSYHH